MNAEPMLDAAIGPVADHAVEPSRVLGELDGIRGRIQQRVQEARSLSEREILAAGNVLTEIMVNARQLADESDRQIEASKAQSEEIAGRFVSGMKEDLLAQQTAVQRVMELANGIEAAVTAINDLTLSSRILAINARIEAARLGEQGKGFAVIASNLTGLSSIIQNASDRVSSSIHAVREGLPRISARADSLHERTQLFIDEVAAQVRATRTGKDDSANNKLGMLMELSSQAISHLQFQDPMVQKLAEIEHDMDRVRARVSQLLRGA